MEDGRAMVEELASPVDDAPLVPKLPMWKLQEPGAAGAAETSVSGASSVSSASHRREESFSSDGDRSVSDSFDVHNHDRYEDLGSSIMSFGNTFDNRQSSDDEDDIFIKYMHKHTAACASLTSGHDLHSPVVQTLSSLASLSGNALARSIENGGNSFAHSVPFAYGVATALDNRKVIRDHVLSLHAKARKAQEQEDSGSHIFQEQGSNAASEGSNAEVPSKPTHTIEIPYLSAPPQSARPCAGVESHASDKFCPPAWSARPATASPSVVTFRSSSARRVPSSARGVIPGASSHAVVMDDQNSFVSPVFQHSVQANADPDCVWDYALFHKHCNEFKDAPKHRIRKLRDQYTDKVREWLRENSIDTKYTCVSAPSYEEKVKASIQKQIELDRQSGAHTESNKEWLARKAHIRQAQVEQMQQERRRLLRDQLKAELLFSFRQQLSQRPISHLTTSWFSPWFSVFQPVLQSSKQSVHVKGGNFKLGVTDEVEDEGALYHYDPSSKRFIPTIQRQRMVNVTPAYSRDDLEKRLRVARDWKSKFARFGSFAGDAELDQAEAYDQEVKSKRKGASQSRKQRPSQSSDSKVSHDETAGGSSQPNVEKRGDMVSAPGGPPPVTKAERFPLVFGESYHLQGDPDLYSRDRLRQRAEIFYDEEIQALLEQFWATCTLDQKFGLCREEYVQLHMRMMKALRTDWRKDDLRTAALYDWNRDTRGKVLSLSKEAFFQSLFEVVDLWTETIDRREYILFLKTLYCRVANLDRVSWKPLDQVVSGFDLAKARRDARREKQRLAAIQQKRDSRYSKKLNKMQSTNTRLRVRREGTSNLDQDAMQAALAAFQQQQLEAQRSKQPRRGRAIPLSSTNLGDPGNLGYDPNNPAEVAAIAAAALAAAANNGQRPPRSRGRLAPLLSPSGPQIATSLDEAENHVADASSVIAGSSPPALSSQDTPQYVDETRSGASNPRSPVATLKSPPVEPLHRFVHPPGHGVETLPRMTHPHSSANTPSRSGAPSISISAQPLFSPTKPSFTPMHAGADETPRGHHVPTPKDQNRATGAGRDKRSKSRGVRSPLAVRRSLISPRTRGRLVSPLAHQFQRLSEGNQGLALLVAAGDPSFSSPRERGSRKKTGNLSFGLSGSRVSSKFGPNSNNMPLGLTTKPLSTKSKRTPSRKSRDPRSSSRPQTSRHRPRQDKFSFHSSKLERGRRPPNTSRHGYRRPSRAQRPTSGFSPLSLGGRGATGVGPQVQSSTFSFRS